MIVGKIQGERIRLYSFFVYSHFLVRGVSGSLGNTINDVSFLGRIGEIPSGDIPSCFLACSI